MVLETILVAFAMFSAIPLLDMALALYSDGTTFGSTGIEAYTPQGG